VSGRRPDGWGRLPQCSIDDFKNAIEIFIDVAVPKTQHAKPCIVQAAITITVALDMILHIVLTAIDFDNETMLQTREVDDMTTFRILAAKMKSTATP
jgi:hypothetical protein